MTQNGRGAAKWGEAKNGTASNRDNVPRDDFSLASGILDRIENPGVHRRRCSWILVERLCSTEIPSGLWAVETRGITSAPASGQQNCVGHHRGDCLPQGDFHPLAERPIKALPNGAENENRELGVVLAAFNRVRPLAGLTLALVATVGWIALLGYVAIKLF
jgi:hypothetical protein